MERGGWQPVIRRRPMGYQQDRFRESGMFTVFVDNLPESMDLRGLFKLFNYGVVKDVFIPKKKRGTRFGFVWYDCLVATSMAIQKAEGLWCDDKELKVRIAAYGNKDQNLKMQGSRKKSINLIKQRMHWQPIEGVKGQSSYVDVVRGFNRDIKRIPFNAEEIGNEIGGRVAVLTFQSVEQMKEWKVKLEEWIYEWCISIEEWEKGKMIESERCVWLYCFGIPFNLWNTKTLNDIGSVWGEVAQHDEVRVCEEISFPLGITTGLGSYQLNEDKNSSFGSGQNMISCTIEGRKEVAKEDEGGDDVSLTDEVASRVKDTMECGIVELDRRGRRVEVSSLRKSDGGLGNSTSGGSGSVGMMKIVENPMKNVVGSMQKIDDNIYTLGFMQSLSSPEMGKPNINLEVVLQGAHDEANHNRPTGHSLSNLSDCVAQTQIQ
ncbi:hypothetical protein ACSBR1_030437 [Camellia fascicularis]